MPEYDFRWAHKSWTALAKKFCKGGDRVGKIQETIWLLTVKCRTPAYPWVEGTFEESLPDRTFVADSYSFKAKVFGNNSRFGINHGRISKLTVWKNELGRKDSDREILANYDRGWDIQPTDETAKDALQRIVTGLENLPTQ